MLLAMQAWILIGGWFFTDWDVSTITDFGNEAYWSYYYARYPNQLFLAGLFAHIAELGSAFGISGYSALVIISCFCVTASIAMAANIARRIGGFSAGYASFALLFVLSGLSPWILVPYSDTYGMLFTSTVLFAYTCIRKPFARWFFIILGGLIGFFIKPTVIFALFAVVCIEAIALIGRIARKKEIAACNTRHMTPASCTSGIAAVLIAFIIAFGVNAAISLPNNSPNNEAAFSASRFLMMGFNEKTEGLYNDDDVDYSASFETPSERTQANLRVWVQRINGMGLPGTAKLLLKKTLTNYADGTFAWEREGSFYVYTGGNSTLVKSLYGIDDAVAGEKIVLRNPEFAPISQVLWLLILAGIAFEWWRKKPTPQEGAMPPSSTARSSTLLE